MLSATEQASTSVTLLTQLSSSSFVSDQTVQTNAASQSPFVMLVIDRTYRMLRCSWCDPGEVLCSYRFAFLYCKRRLVKF